MILGDDLRNRSMLVAVVTPYHNPANNAWLLKCIESVRQQTYNRCFHVLVGDGYDCSDISPSESIHKLTLSRNIGDYGDSPRSLGAIYALAKGADAVTFLDSDNWYEKNHIKSLLQKQKATQAQVVTSYRKLAQLNGEIMGICPSSDGLTFCDTSCMLFTRSASDVAASWWTIPKAYHAIDDRIIWDRVLSARYSITCTKEPTIIYRSGFKHHYEMFGIAVPENAKVGISIGRLNGTMISLRNRAAANAPKLIRP